MTTQPEVIAVDPKTITRKAEVALTRGVIVVEGTDVGEVKLPAAADEGLIVGVVKDDAAIDTQVEIYYAGIVPVLSNAAITRGNPVAIGAATGKAKTAAPGAGANSFLAGFARSTTSGADKWLQVELGKSVMQGA